ncbi:carnitine 3-dehydrogenase [Yoonia sediminilitoris]|uniref:L-carnitine dehydrogenase n=1 Tax=Yoonia sediminilitoris TaxID=1286148 RepID=A0A2T6KB89_9RHOB|nr:carnitine 3-dehydrogenase [Yoonia sediminilitoris]PUB12087.1 carnitine 3-dehydrogenase [Yoonia sediminilitoris]RCW92914.1 carnitine 3-dehydrogenase [Yoonia sediminilitoris]
MTQTAAIIGGGVIGGGWAARFLLMGWDVRVFDPDPDATRKIHEVLDNARRSLPGISDVALPDEGRLSFHDTMTEAVEGAVWIQESVPERLELKRRVYQTIQEHCDPSAVIASSTSGFKPSQLQGCATRPAQILVAHPFNPVYLLPLVELVPSDQTPPAHVERSKDILTGIGMYPLHVRAEIDAHIADRFLEAVWREALWLIKDGIATTEEIDNAIRYGFGLRWAQMGLFETYRIAGGEAGMRHFIEQFGPCLEWPWTKLMDVPTLTDDLIDKIAGQSDAQSGQYTIRQLERARDNNLVTILRGLKGQDYGAGALLNAHDARLQGDIRLPDDLSKPIVTIDRVVPLDWTDYNGHMNEAKYLQAFGDATDRLMWLVGCDADYIASGSSFFTAETHIRHLDEVHAGTRIRVETQVLQGTGKKLHVFHRMFADTRELATGEHFLLHVNLETRKACDPDDRVAVPMARVAAAHADLPRPEGAGAAVGIR